MTNNTNDMDKWIIQLRKGVFELAILSLINNRSVYGYELTTNLKKFPMFDLSDGAIYPILKRLTQRNWITFYWAESEGGPKRKYYQITEEGREILSKRWADYKEMYNSLQTIAEVKTDE